MLKKGGYFPSPNNVTGEFREGDSKHRQGQNDADMQ